MGIYPMLLDETCFFLAVDFDKSSWQEDFTLLKRELDDYQVHTLTTF